MKKQFIILAILGLVLSTVFTSCIEYRRGGDWRYERNHHHRDRDRDHDRRW
ncbi:MAG TPA: hypothetical protein VGO09_05430 [Flavisolibacter sp.]|nr:hypothetical protein [Flavisolibacter sp.]